MKRLTIALLTVALASCGSEASDRSGAQPMPAVDLAKARRCAERVTVLFWPEGHPSIPSIAFPSLAMPHVEMYGGTDRTYPMGAALGWAFATQPGPSFPQRSTKPDCLSAVSIGDLDPIPDAESSQTAVRLVCRLPEGAQIAIEESGRHRYRFAVLHPTADPAVDGTVGTDSSQLSYSPSACKPTAAPGP
jgi:hypothetical protein